MLKRTRLSLAVTAAFGLGIAGVTPAALSQTQLERVEVTGSMIKRIEGETALPVTVLKADDLAKAGVTNAEQAVNFIVQNQSSTVTADSVGSSTGGAAYADLRGIGSARTLVLVNGKRLVNNPYSAQSVDLNALPMAAIERVEALTDGASAIYGTDAIAGVINFITRKEYQGIALAADAVMPQETGGGEIYSAGITAGFGELAKQGWNVFGAFSWRQQKPLAATERDFAKTAVIMDRGVLKPSSTTFPANYSQTINGNTVVGNPTSPACDPPYSLSLPELGSTPCWFDYVPFINIVPEQEQISLLGRGSLALGRDHTASVEYLYAKNTVDSVISPTPLTGLSMPPSSPYYPGNGITPANPALDPTRPISLGWRTTLVQGRASRFENETDRIMGSLEGVVFGWDYNASVFKSTSTVINTFTGGYLNNQGIRNGLNGANGAPFLNPFGPQSAEGLAYVTNNLILGELQKAEGDLFGVTANVSKEIFRLPAGGVNLALGAEYYKDENSYTNNFALIRQAASSGLAGAEDITGDRDITAFLAEVNVPIIKGLELGLAVRYDDYSDFGSTTNPKISLRWQPVADLLVRGSYNTGFRAPTLQDVYAPNSLTYTARRYNDPLLCPGGVVNPGAGGVSVRDCGLQFQQQQGGNRNLQPEESTAWTVGFVWQATPALSFGLDYWNLEVTDQISVLGESTIFGDTAKYSNLFVRCSQATAAERDLIGACAIPGGDPLAYIINTQLNLGDLKTSGIDASMQWNGTPGAYGRFSAGIRATYLTKYEYQLEPQGEFFDNLGNYFNSAAVARYQHVMNVGWSAGPWSALLVNRYRRGYVDANEEAGVEPEFWGRTKPWSTWDISATYTGLKGFTFTAGILNALDADPPFSNQGDAFQVGYDQRNSNPYGRQFLVRVGYEFK